jgi:hypothetical protein
MRGCVLRPFFAFPRPGGGGGGGGREVAGDPARQARAPAGAAPPFVPHCLPLSLAASRGVCVSVCLLCLCVCVSRSL